MEPFRKTRTRDQAVEVPLCGDRRRVTVGIPVKVAESLALLMTTPESMMNENEG